MYRKITSKAMCSISINGTDTVNLFFCVLWWNIFMAQSAPAAPPQKENHNSTASGTRRVPIFANILSSAKARNASNEAMAIMWISKFIVIDMKATARSQA